MGQAAASPKAQIVRPSICFLEEKKIYVGVEEM
jgi:hypothetical protein